MCILSGERSVADRAQCGVRERGGIEKRVRSSGKHLPHRGAQIALLPSFVGVRLSWLVRGTKPMAEGGDG